MGLRRIILGRASNIEQASNLEQLGLDHNETRRLSRSLLGIINAVRHSLAVILEASEFFSVCLPEAFA